MMIRRNWKIRVDPEEYCTQMGEELARLRQKSGWEEMLGQAAAELEQAISPAACWERYPVRETRHGRIILENGLRLGSEEVAQMLSGAESLVAAVLTLGSGPDRIVQAAQQQGGYLKALLLHDMASMAVDTLQQQVCRELETQAHQAGWHTSAPISPGEARWSIEDQRVIFALLDAGQIGVTLTESLVMVPIKSLSLVMGEGTQAMGIAGADACSYCTIQEHCRYRSRRNAAA
jgi:hypothetical protein